MVNLTARKQAAEVLGQFYHCEINNDQFVDQWFEIKSKDIVLKKVFWLVWGFYDDLHTHKLEGKHALSQTGKDLFERCILFLKSDVEYPWPKKAKLAVPTAMYRKKRKIFWISLLILVFLYLFIAIKFHFFILFGIFLVPIVLFCIDRTLISYWMKSEKEIVFYEYQKGMEYWPFQNELEYRSMLKRSDNDSSG